MEKLKIRQINFDYGRGIVTIYYVIEKLHYVDEFTFTVWAENDHFNETDLKDMIARYN